MLSIFSFKQQSRHATTLYRLVKLLVFGFLLITLGAQASVARHRVAGDIECPGGSFTGTSSAQQVYLFEVATPQRVELRAQGLGSSVVSLRVYAVAPDAYDAASNVVDLDSQLEMLPDADADFVAFFSHTLSVGHYALLVEFLTPSQDDASYMLDASFLGSCLQASVNGASARQQEGPRRRQKAGVFDPALHRIHDAVNDWLSNQSNAEAAYGHISTWNTTGITSMHYLFFNTSTFNDDISAWDTSSVRDMSYMFCRAEAFNQDISAWDTSNVTDMYHMFVGAQAFDQLLCWDLSSLSWAWSIPNVALGSEGKVFDKSCPACPCALKKSSSILTTLTMKGSWEDLQYGDALQAAFVRSIEVAICEAAGLLDPSGRCTSSAVTTVVVRCGGIACNDSGIPSRRSLQSIGQRRRAELVAEFTSNMIVPLENAKKIWTDPSESLVSALIRGIAASLQQAEDVGRPSSFLQRLKAALLEEVQAAGGEIDGFTSSNAGDFSETVLLTASDVQFRGEE
uniref:BspA family leucine-rich repeat surface protein n=1 Tax=Pinguiococcus pyrenoidosus TaxID=172671 RepID=A0A7R9Y9P3_9STRA|mmetsp:Transcript_11924/g.44333  ORF Transcript_11924/g.44333 Transcript_11924/m.44333 type:complete len:512 (+) Transcript_11924:231-1766(+)|eukprot:scaffold3022_cov150-Pinguiococcus_pyrenoidosus.AAC.3